MVKFKFFKKGFKGVKCLVRKALMAKPLEDSVPSTIKRATNQTETKSTSVVPSASSTEGFIPLAARDSQWVGIEFYNPNFRSPLDEDDDVQEVELHSLASDGTDALLLLFPGLSKTENRLIKEHESSSTTEITKLLVGQKADFRSMKSSRKLLPTENKLTSVQEMPQEEKNQSETDISIGATRKKYSISDIDNAERYDDDEEEPKRSTHTKRRKKKSDVKLLTKGASSSSVIEVHRKPSSRLRPNNSMMKNASMTKSARSTRSGESSFADDEEIQKKS